MSSGTPLARLQRFAQGLGNLTLVALMLLGVWLAPKVASGPQLFDAGELAEASVMLGGSHPPGQPLHALLSHFMLWLPLGPIAARLALFSLITTLAAAATLAALTHELLDAQGVHGTQRELAKAVAAVALVLADPVLRQALRIEVYGLALMLALLSMLLLVRWARRGQARELVAAAFFAGLCASTHPPQAGCAVLLGLALVALRPRLITQCHRALPMAALSCVLGLSLYAYLHVRALAAAPMWGAPSTMTGWLEYVSTRAYVQNAAYGSAQQSLLGNALGYGRYLIEVTFGLPLLGIAVLIVKRPREAWLAHALLLALLAGLCSVSLQPLQEGVPDMVAYAAPVLGLAIALAAAGFAVMAFEHAQSPRAWIGATALLCLPLAASANARTASTLQADLPLLETLGVALTEAPPARALVVATTDFTGATWMMSRAIDRSRPDVALFVAGLSTSSWHWRSLASHPAFDGKPKRGAGRDAHERFLNGAIMTALQRVPVVLERDTSLAMPYAIDGAYAMLQPISSRPAPPQNAQTLLNHTIGERLEPVIAAELATSPPGDSGAALAIARDHFLQRAQRFMSDGKPRRAMTALRGALGELSQAETTLLQTSLRDGEPHPLPPVVAEPKAFLVTRDQAVRAGAAALWALGDREHAVALLEAQTATGDARAVLELCTLQGLDHERNKAMACLTQFQALAPELVTEALPLARALVEAGAPVPVAPAANRAAP